MVSASVAVGPGLPAPVPAGGKYPTVNEEIDAQLAAREAMDVQAS